MQGKPIFAEEGATEVVRGPLDPRILSQSGSAPGALIFPEGRPTEDGSADPHATPQVAASEERS